MCGRYTFASPIETVADHFRLSDPPAVLPPRYNVAPTQTTRYLDTSGAGSWSIVANRNFGDRNYGSAVMYADGKVLVLGGGDPPTNTAEVIDLNQPSPTWRTAG